MPRNFSRDYEDGTPFLRIFFAVLLALIVHNLLQLMVASILARSAAEDLRRSLEQVQQSAPVVQDTGPAVRDSYDVSPQLPSMPGPIRAKSQGLSQACVNGRVTQRLPTGWQQGNSPCSAYSD